jgi:hydroxymethylpyrimidine/phosphomethylpyrimidine kinase
MRTDIPCVVTIAGTDPSGGAGIQADIKAISATGSYAASIITALVAQNTVKVHAIHDVSAEFIQSQIDAVFGDLQVAAIKIGMLNKKEVIDVVATSLDRLLIKKVVFDPVMVAKNGSPLIEPHLIDYLKERVFPNCTLITPNIPEAEALLNTAIVTEDDMLQASQALGDRYGLDVLVKGGHFDKPEASDVLFIYASQQHHWFHAPRINTRNTHGTGCTFSSAIASYLAQDKPLIKAVECAKYYLTRAIQSGSDQCIGRGFGPVDHFYFLEQET